VPARQSGFGINPGVLAHGVAEAPALSEHASLELRRCFGAVVRRTEFLRARLRGGMKPGIAANVPFDTAARSGGRDIQE
jgi:hypothetical protein